jgi:hypothetical protein
MRTVRAVLFRLIGFLDKNRGDRELAEELASHLQMEIEANLRLGMAPEEARRAAVLKSGGLEAAKEACRDRRGLPWLETVLGDLRHAARILRRSPVSTAAAVFSLALGRFFTDQEEAQGERVLSIGHGLWQRRFGGDRGIVGRRISVNREAYTVVGVMPAGFESPRLWKTDWSPEVWVPARLSRADRERDSHWLAAIGRLKRGVSRQTADEDIRGIAAVLAKQYPRASGRVTTWTRPVKDLEVGDVRKPLQFLLAAVVALLLISSANVASIQFARSNGRQRKWPSGPPWERGKRGWCGSL